MAEATIKVTLEPNTKKLNRALSKAKSLSFNGGDIKGDKERKKEETGKKKRDKKRDDLLSKIVKSVGIIAVVSALLSGLTDLIRPFVSLFAALSALVFFPLWDALSPVLVDFADFLKRVRAAGGGPGGFVEAAAGPTEGQTAAGIKGLPNLGTAIAGSLTLLIAGVILAAIPFVSGATLGLALTAAIAGLIIIKLPSITENIQEKIGEFWTRMLGALLLVVGLTAAVIFGGWIFALVALLIAAVIRFLPQLKKFFTEIGPKIRDAIVNTFNKSIEVLRNIGSIIKDKILGFFSFFGGTSSRAHGGPVTSGVPFIVGERGPELFVPNTPGNIIPNNALSSQQSVGGSITLNINNPVIRNEQDIRKLADEISRVMAKGKLRGFSSTF